MSFHRSANSPSTDSTDIEEACEGVSHTVFSDIFVPVSDESTESSLHKEALMVSFQEPEQVDVCAFFQTNYDYS